MTRSDTIIHYVFKKCDSDNSLRCLSSMSYWAHTPEKLNWELIVKIKRDNSLIAIISLQQLIVNAINCN